mgnify:CR=1 FL=1
MTQIQLYTSPTVRLDGLKLTGNLLACSIRANFQSGTCLEYELRGQPLKPSEVEQVVQNLLSTCLTSPLRSFAKLLDVNLAPSNVTTSAVRLHRSLSSAGSAEVLSSVCLTSLTTESEEPSQASGG